MNILYIYDGHWPRNATRVGKQVDALLRAGHHVRILSRSWPGLPRREENGRLAVGRMWHLSNQLLNRIVNYPLFLNPAWLLHAWRHAREVRPDCIIVRDLPLAPTALAIGRLFGAPVHYDMAEVYPLGMLSIMPHEMTPAIRVVRATRAAFAVERLVLRKATTTFVVSEESRTRLLGLGIPSDQVVLVGNTPANADALRRSWPVPNDMKDLEGKPIAIFVGNLFADRGLDLAIAAMTFVTRELAAARLVIIGEGRDRARLETQVRDLGLADHVRFLGWKHHSAQPAYLRHAQVGVLPYPSTPHTRTTLPNKIFDYIAAGLPVVATDIPPMRRIVTESNSGLLTPPGDAGAFAAALIKLFRDHELRTRLGCNGERAIAGPYNWAQDEQRFIGRVERFMHKRHQTAPL